MCVCGRVCLCEADNKGFEVRGVSAVVTAVDVVIRDIKSLTNVSTERVSCFLNANTNVGVRKQHNKEL